MSREYWINYEHNIVRDDNPNDAQYIHVREVNEQLDKAIEAMVKALKHIENCMLDGSYEKFGSDGVVIRNITAASLALEQYNRAKGDAK